MGPRPARRPHQQLLAATLAGVAAVTVVLAGCGLQKQPGSGHAPTPAAAKGTLSVQTVNTSTPEHWTLRCDPVGGTMPDPAASCKALLGTKSAFEPSKHPIACPMIMVSPKQIVITGTWFGKKVHRVIIDGSCDIGLFDSLSKTFN
jgi:hypothetical protein